MRTLPFSSGFRSLWAWGEERDAGSDARLHDVLRMLLQTDGLGIKGKRGRLGHEQVRVLVHLTDNMRGLRGSLTAPGL